MADKTLVEKAGEAVGFGIAMAEDVAGTVKTAFGAAVTTVAGVLKKTPAKKASAEKTAGKTPAKKATKKATGKKAVKKPSAKAAANKAPAKKAAKKAVKSTALRSGRRSE